MTAESISFSEYSSLENNCLRRSHSSEEKDQLEESRNARRHDSCSATRGQCLLVSRKPLSQCVSICSVRELCTEKREHATLLCFHGKLNRGMAVVQGLN